MADRTYADISAALSQVFQAEIVRQINRRSVLLQLLTAEENDNKQLAWDVGFTGATGGVVTQAGTYAENANFQDPAVSLPYSDAIIPATLHVGQYKSHWRYTGLAEASAKASASPRALANLLTNEVLNAVNWLASIINRDLYRTLAVNGATGIAGFATAVNNSVGVAGIYAAANGYAGINHADPAGQAQWGAFIENGGGGAITMPMMRNVEKGVYTACGYPPDLIITNPDDHASYGAIFESAGAGSGARRWVDQVSVNKGEIKLSGGYKALDFDGIPVIRDKDCPANQVFFLNTNFLKIRYLNPTPVPDSQQMREALASGELGETGPSGNLPVAVEFLGKRGDMVEGYVKAYLQLQLERRNSAGVLANIL